MGVKLIYIPHDDQQFSPCVVQNYWLKRLETTKSKPTNPNSIKVPTDFEQTT